MISSWIDFVLWLDDHEGNDGKLEVSPNRVFQELVEMASPNSPSLHGDVNDRFRPNTWEGSLGFESRVARKSLYVMEPTGR